MVGETRTSVDKVITDADHSIHRYLYERELYDHAELFLANGLDILNETDTLMYAAACTLRGLVELDTKRLSAARESFLTGINIREKLLSPDDPFVASSLNALSLVSTELNQLDKAVDYGDRAIEIRLKTDIGRIGNSYSNMASTLLKLAKPDDAEEMLGRCPSLKDFSDETFLSSGNPRFAGWVYLEVMAWIVCANNIPQRHDSAKQNSTKAGKFRCSATISIQSIDFSSKDTWKSVEDL